VVAGVSFRGGKGILIVKQTVPQIGIAVVPRSFKSYPLCALMKFSISLLSSLCFFFNTGKSDMFPWN
jgi:hypothetical protein